ncbi:MAG: hypothetical protein ACRDOK_14310 [Streptosporangiaceae bacterium]
MRGRYVPPAAKAVPGDGPAGEFFAALGEAWRPTAAQEARLAPAVEAAVDSGWAPAEVASFIGGNTDGVRNPYAVLARPLSADELPVAPGGAAARRPPWCGRCDERTRRRENADGVGAGRCTSCHPLAAS